EQPIEAAARHRDRDVDGAGLAQPDAEAQLTLVQALARRIARIHDRIPGPVFGSDNAAFCSLPPCGGGVGRGGLFDPARQTPASRLAFFERSPPSPTRGEVTGARGEPCGSSLEAGPAVGQQALLRQEAALVVHLLRALHPIAEIDVAQAEPACAGYMVE